MCRYAIHTYRTHYVCTACQVSFKARPPTVNQGALPARCPHCAGPMIDAGKDLRVPRRRDKDGWRTLTALLNAGVRFHSCGCCGPGYRPRSMAELRRWSR